jgi:hypothetical protein
MHRSSTYPWTYIESLVAGYRARSLFDDVRTYAMFIGQPRSGTSLLGSIINAHRNVCMSHELNALRYIRRGYGRAQLFWLIKKRDEWFGESGRKWTGYDYTVEGEWQGQHEKLLVIGDKKAGCTTEMLRKYPNLFDKLQRVVNVPIRMIHLVRDPYNVIRTIHKKRSRTSLELATKMFLDRCETNWRLMQQHGDTILTIRLEELIAEPEQHLKDLCGFLGIEATAEYVRACSSVLFEKPRQSKTEISWPPELVERIERQAERFPFLAGYSFEQKNDGRLAEAA